MYPGTLTTTFRTRNPAALSRPPRCQALGGASSSTFFLSFPCQKYTPYMLIRAYTTNFSEFYTYTSVFIRSYISLPRSYTHTSVCLYAVSYTQYTIRRGALCSTPFHLTLEAYPANSARTPALLALFLNSTMLAIVLSFVIMWPSV